VRGDAYYAKKDPAKAAEQYKKALIQADPQSMDSALLALKIADLGLAPAAAPPPAAASGAPAAAPPTAATAPPVPASPAAPPSSNKAKP
jgi:hypothetical protein